ncbi:serine/threonine-protein kinase [Chroococcidiopsis sp. CCMEE 29]|uniref:serine/threonine-protein kinase n=1 Tax=Chroococcidiopsis sp. CCMEE 29 TaxID=155894 RepID=UPI002020DBC8|nr:serine/threonine-protein kinase [Chroococcidiopsis sp. CCMEE 29]
MSYCLNPNCQKPLNPLGTNFCQSCGTKIQLLLRNRYRIIRPLSGGGFGRTFLAEDEDKLNEPCVVKQLTPQLQGTNALQKATQLFQEEARRLQQLGEHPQIPTLYAYFEQDSYLYLVQQLIVGQTLRQELEQQGIFSEQKIWKLLTDLLPVLQFVHAHQVIHRDIKPENIIRRQSDSKLVLIDFGVAKHLTTTAITKPGTSIDSFGYASLEQMNSGDAYPASDLYSLGVTCFHLLTRIHPSKLWAEQGYSWLANWQQYLNTSISQKLTQVIDRLLQKDIHLRYQSVNEVIQDLNAPAQPPIIPPPVSLTQPPPSAIGLNQPFERKPLPIAEPELLRSKPYKHQLFPTLAPAKLFKNRLLAGGIILLLGLAGYGYWQSIRNIPTLTGHSGEVNTIAFSPDGQNIASGSDDRTIKIWQLNSRKELRTLKGHADWVYAVAISPDGKTLVSGSKDNTIKVWNLNTRQELRILPDHKSYVNAVAISPDGQKIASGSYDKTIKIWNLNTGQISTLVGHSREVLSVAISPNAQQLVSASADRTIKVWNLNTGKELSTLTGHSGDVNSIAISSNSQLLVSVSDDKTIKIWNLNTGREIRTFTGHSGDINAVAISPDGQAIATGSDDKTIKVWNPITGEEINTLRGHLGPVYAVIFSPNGHTLVSGSADKTIKIWQLPK